MFYQANSNLNDLVSLILRALVRARIAIITVTFAYLISLTVGILMTHTGNQFALAYRDRLVAQVRKTDPAAMAFHKGNKLQAALLDFSRNLLLGAIPQTVAGTTIIVPYLLAVYRGWIGGIVSVNDNHASRLADKHQATYYIIVLVLQLIPYSLAGGAGVNLGLAFFRPPSYYTDNKWLGLPREAILDVLRIYSIVIPLFFIASLWEFLSPN